MKACEERLRQLFAGYFEGQRARAASALGKADMDDLAGMWNQKEKERLLAELEDALKEMAQDGAAAAAEQIAFLMEQGDAEADIEALLRQANEAAVAWAEERAADLVTQVDDTTREGIRGLVGQAEAEGWSNDELADQIQEFTGFSDYRSEMIARTETAFADINGNLIGWRESGVVQSKTWATGAGCCEDCEALDGMTVPLDEDFPGGDPPLHPNCRCALVPGLGPAGED